MKKNRQNDLKTFADETAQKALRCFGKEIEAHGKQFKNRLCRLIRLNLPPYPGRPEDPRWTRAVELKAEGWSYRQIARCLYERFDAMGEAEQRDTVITVMKRVHSRRRRARKQAAELKSTANQAANEVASQFAGDAPESAHEAQDA